ncbi:MAG: hypothetical protein DBX59_10915 [Bacillota bacterium]|nr:MAG: hypothetical protein DBX59_10915 [Bacillota bacterium]
MLKEKKLSIAGKFLLLAATLVWGTSFFITKDALNDFPPLFVLAFRFLLGGALLLAVFHQSAFRLTGAGFLWALLLGVVTAAAYILQTYGIKISGSASKTAVLTVTYCIFVPFMCFAFFRERPSAHHVVAAALCFCGIGLISINGGFSLNWGDALSLASGIFFALQIIVGKKLIQSGAALGGLPVALLAVGIICGVSSVLFESGEYFAMSFSWQTIWPLLYLAVLCTCAAQAFQIVGQKWTSANETALILSFESVFGAAFGIAFGGDEANARMIIGFVLVFAAVLVCETKMGAVFRRKNKKTEGENEDD